ncbi:MAG: hypothetical protein WCE68_12905 [Anaerolineales bacterium]
MNRKHNLNGIYSIIGLIIVLGIALGSDFLMTSMIHRNAGAFGTFPTTSILWFYILLALLLAAALLLLFWSVLKWGPRNIWVAVIFLLTGLFIVTYPILYFIPAFGSWFDHLPQLNDILSSPRSYTFFSGGFIAITGLFTLILPRGKDSTFSHS